MSTGSLRARLDAETTGEPPAPARFQLSETQDDVAIFLAGPAHCLQTVEDSPQGKTPGFR